MSKHFELVQHDRPMGDSREYRGAFECRRPFPTSQNAKTFEDYYNLSLHKEEFLKHVYTDTGTAICIHWFRPRRIRTGLERIYCVLSWGSYGTDRAYYIGYAGGTGLNKIHAAFYDVLYQMGIEVYRNGTITTAHHALIDIMPALIRCLYAGTPHTDVTAWEHSFYALN